MSTGANVLPTYELEANGYNVTLVQTMVVDMQDAIDSYPASKEKTYLEEVMRDVYPEWE